MTRERTRKGCSAWSATRREGSSAGQGIEAAFPGWVAGDDVEILASLDAREKLG
jgi:hypothetical protein